MRRKFKGGIAGGIGKAVRRAVIQSSVRPAIRTVVRPAAPMRVVPPALKQAHNLMGKSKFNDAGNIFEQFANSKLASHEKQAPQFYVQAGRARLMSGEVPAGMALLKVGLAALTRSGNLAMVALIAQRIIAELIQNGHPSEAEQIQSMLGGFLPPESIPATPVPEAEDEEVRLLPTNCPSCGGPMLPKEVEWLDENTAECAYCGNGIRTELEEENTNQS